MSVDIINMTQYEANSQAIDVALPVLAIECEATPPLENYLDTYEELTQSEVAHEVGIDLQSYQKFESGKRKLENCSMRIGLQVCAALELDPYELLFFHRK